MVQAPLDGGEIPKRGSQQSQEKRNRDLSLSRHEAIQRFIATLFIEKERYWGR